MHSQSLPGDILSNLPDNIIDLLLVCLPCKDAVRTSILSKKWRYNWCRRTEFALEESHSGFTQIINQLLTRHEGSITKFTLDISHLSGYPKIDFFSDISKHIDNFIHFLSMNDLQHLVLHVPWNKRYELPSSFYACSSLRHLSLEGFIVHPPPSFKGFDRLISLELCRITICSTSLGILISHCPLLEELVLYFLKVSGVTEIDSLVLRSFTLRGDIPSIRLKNVPLLTELSLFCPIYRTKEGYLDAAKCFAPCSSLNYLKRLYTHMDKNLSCALYLMRSSPYLQDIEVEIHSPGVLVDVDEVAAEFSDVTLNNLRTINLIAIDSTNLLIQLSKHMLAKAPMLVRMLIKPIETSKNYDVNYDVKAKVLAELAKFHRASPEVEVVVLKRLGW